MQVIKDPLGTKGARLTTFIALPSRYLVYMPRGEGIGVSARIDDEAERQRLKAAVARADAAEARRRLYPAHRVAGGAVESLREDMVYLDKLWQHVRVRALETRPARSCTRTCLWRCACCGTSCRAASSRVLVDSPREHARMMAFAAAFMPDAATRIELYPGPRPIFDLHGIEDEIGKALERKVHAEVRRSPGDRPDARR